MAFTSPSLVKEMSSTIFTDGITKLLPTATTIITTIPILIQAFKLRWESKLFSYGGKVTMILEVLTEKVAPEFLAYLDELGIPYTFAGKDDLDSKLFLQKLKEIYHVDTFVLCGGAQINAEFMRHDLVDEISLVVAPAIDGSRNGLTFVGADDVCEFPKFYKLKEMRQIGDNAVLLHYTK